MVLLARPWRRRVVYLAHSDLPRVPLSQSYPRQKGMTNVLFPVSHTSAYPTAPQIATWIKKANITPTELDVGHINTLLAVLEYDGEIQALPASSSYDDSRGGGSVSSSKVVNVASKRKKKGESDSDDSDAEREKEEKRAKKRKEEKRRKQEKERKKLEAKKRKKKEERRRKKKKKGGSSDDESDSGSGSDSESETGSDSDDNSDSSDVKSSRSVISSPAATSRTPGSLLPLRPSFLLPIQIEIQIEIRFLQTL